jgi:hypothetical protein
MADISDYTPEMLERAKEYLVVYESLGERIPTKEGMAEYLGKAVKTLYNWSEKPENDEFLQVMDMCMTQQGKKLINGGLGNEYNSTITKLMLGKHGYKESTETDITTKGKELGSLLGGASVQENNSNGEDPSAE